MARYIHCEKCDKNMRSSADCYGELYESIEGIAVKDMFCDGGCYSGDSPTPIKKGDKCFAAVLLNNTSHPNYRFQRPEAWAHEFLRPTELSTTNV